MFGIIHIEQYCYSGGSSGIGLSVALAVIERGASVTLIARNRDKLEMAREQVIFLTFSTFSTFILYL